MKNRIFKSETDRFSAPDVATATQLRDKSYGYEPGGEESKGDPFEVVPMADYELLKVTFDGQDDVPKWVRGEPMATVNKVFDSERVRVTATAEVWAKHEKGMVGSTEF